MNENAKKPFNILVILSLALLLSGCAENHKRSETSSAELSAKSTQSTSTASSAVSGQSTKSSQSGAPSVIAPNFRGSSSGEQSVPEPSDNSSTEEYIEIPSESTTDISTSEERSEIPDTSLDEPPYEIFPTNTIEGGEVRTVSDSETYIKSGEVLEVKGTLVVENGASLFVEAGGILQVDGIVKLDGDIVLTDGGRLVMGYDNALIDGIGSIVVKDNFEQIDCERGWINVHIAPPERVVENGVTTVGGVVIANKAIKLPPEYGSWLSEGEVTSETYNALVDMNNHSDHSYYIVSAYRSYYSQESIFKGWCDIYGFEEASTISSQAGHSEHQTGLTMDLDSLEQSYGNTPEGIWLAENCYKYGFIIRYPKGKDEITGYAYEPWHVRYLGKSTAKLVYNSGLTLEEFLNVEGGTTVID